MKANINVDFHIQKTCTPKNAKHRIPKSNTKMENEKQEPTVNRNEYEPSVRNCSLPEASKTLLLSLTEFLRVQSIDSHIFLFRESPTYTSRFPLNNSNKSPPTNLQNKLN